MSVEPSLRVPNQPQLKRRATLGMVALAVRSGLQNVIVLVATVYLTRLLDPGDYGVFGILQFALSLFKLVGDTGLGAALVQQEHAPDDVELSTLFWFQLGLGLVLALASLASVPLLPMIWPALPSGTEWLMPGLGLSLLFTMLRTVPFLILERAVNFGWVGTLEFLGTIAFYGTAVALALRQSGAGALVWASVAQASVIAILAIVIQPWRPQLTFSWPRIRGLLRFGFAFQGNNVVNFVNSAVTPLLAGAKLGKESLGLLQFAQGTAWFPTLPVGIVRRVYFPYLSRLQQDRPAFVREFELSVLLCALPTFFFFSLFAAGAPAIVGLVYGTKWLSAVPALYLYSIGFCFTFYSWIGSAAVEAMGQVGRMFRIQVLSSALNWGATILALRVSSTEYAFACGYLVHLVVTPVAVWLMTKELVPEAQPIRRTLRLVPALVATAGVGRSLAAHIQGPVSLVAWTVVEIAVFLGAALLLDRELRRLAGRTTMKLRGKS